MNSGLLFAVVTSVPKTAISTFWRFCLHLRGQDKVLCSVTSNAPFSLLSGWLFLGQLFYTLFLGLNWFLFTIVIHQLLSV